MMKKIFVIAAAMFTMASCTKCKDCQVSIEALNGYDLADADAGFQLLGYDGLQDYYDQTMPMQEFCDEALESAEATDETSDLDMDGTDDIRVFYDCK